MTLLNALTGACLLLMNFTIQADWGINTEGKKGIYSSNGNGNQLSIVENGKGVDFYITLKQGAFSFKPEQAVISVSSLTVKAGEMTVTDSDDAKTVFMLNLDRKQKSRLLNRMISELEMIISLSDGQKLKANEKFTLIGFTARLNDLMIAREIGNLNYEWLLENHKDRELLCYYASNIYVRAMQDRLAGGNYRTTLKSIPKTGIDKLDSVTGEMVQNVYSLSERKLPADPRGDKYGIFRACMEKAN